MKETSSRHIRRALRPRLLRLAVVVLMAAALGACDESQLTKSGPNNADNNGNNNTNNLTEEGTDEHGHGPDPDAELIEAGPMTGSWRVSRDEDDALVTNVDIIQEEGNATLEGYYSMGSGIYDRLDGKSGEISDESTYEGTKLVLKWNPTDVTSEMYTIEADQIDDDTFEGKLTAIDYEQLDKQVTITRYNFEDTDDDDGDAGVPE
jgi:hypothetical protein